MANSCFEILNVCNCEGSLLNLAAPSTGTFVMEFLYLEKYWNYEVDLIEGDELQMPTTWNEDSFVEFRLKKNNVYQEIDDVSKWTLKISACSDSESTPVTTSIPYSFNLILADQTGSTIDISGEVITTDAGDITISEDLFETYRMIVYKNGAHIYESFHYTFDPETQVLTFVVALDLDTIILEFVKK